MKAIEGNVTTVYIGDYYEYATQASSIPAQDVTPVGMGVACLDTATGSGYLMYSVEEVGARFAAHPPDGNTARHFVCVKYDNGQWKYDNNLAYYTFTPEPSDVLAAAVNFDTDTVTSLQGTNTTENGIAKGYASGNLTYTADWYNGAANDGEFTVGGTSFTPNTLVTAKKYFYFGGQRVAMRDNGTLYYLFGDHLGSTSLVTNRDGTTKAQQLYTAWGDQRFPSGASTLPTSFRFTGQRESSTGLYYYRARYYDPVIGRFVQADSIIPSTGDLASFDRYAYVRNSPVNFVDPSGHDPNPCGLVLDGQCIDTSVKGLGNPPVPPPTKVNQTKLTKNSDNILYSGQMMYKLYMALYNDKNGWWWDYFGGEFTVYDFLILILAYEFAPYQKEYDNGTLDGQFVIDLIVAATKNFWCSPNGDTNACTNLNKTGGATDEAILNWLGGMESARRRYVAVFGDAYVDQCGNDMNCRVELAFQQDVANLGLAKIVADAMVHPTQFATRSGWTNGNVGGYGEPWIWGNKYLYPNWSPTGQGDDCSQYLDKWGKTNSKTAYILSYCQVVYANSR